MADIETNSDSSKPQTPFVPGKRQASKSNLDELPDSFYYDTTNLFEPSLSLKQLPNDHLQLHHAFGLHSSKRNNIHALDDSNIITAVGNALAVINVRRMESKYILGLREGSIGAIAIDPSRRYIAVGEVDRTLPNIYIFEYPTFKLHRVLREGAELGYADLCFNGSGNKLASIGMNPDYMLTIWNWKQERVLLRSKAFSQDVYRVAFSPQDDGILTTSGMGHIKFWRMSSTFTGLKLQGYIGKFGASELSDIAAFAQLPDGKVVSSTETGNLLLWDGGMIKCEISLKGGKPCHQGRIEVVRLVDTEVITAGEDGFVRLWDFEAIDNADVVTLNDKSDKPAGATSSVQLQIFELDPSDEIFIGKSVKIITMTQTPGKANEYVLQDQNGNLFRLDTKKRLADKLLSFHSGSVVGTDISPLLHSMASLGSDGSIRLYQYVSKALMASKAYQTGGSVITYLPQILDSKGATFAAGFDDGVLRIMSHSYIDPDTKSADLFLQHVLKPHKQKITAVSFSADGKYLATGSEDQTIFLFRINSQTTNHNGDPVVNFSKTTVTFSPIGFIVLNDPVASISFSPDNHKYVLDLEREEAFTNQFNEDDVKSSSGKNFMFVLSTGLAYTAMVPAVGKYNNTVSFELKAELFNVKKWELEIEEPDIAKVPSKSAEKSVEESVKTEGDGNKDVVTNPKPAQNLDDLPEARRLSITRRDHGLVLQHDSRIHSVIYLEGGYLILSFVNADGEGEIRAMKQGMPGKSRLLMVYKTPFSSVKLSKSSKYLLAGTLDGAICVRPFRVKEILLNHWKNGHQTYEQYAMEYQEEIARRASTENTDSDTNASKKLTLGLPGQFYLYHLHDCVEGAVTAVTTSFDDSFIASASTDGTLFVLKLGTESLKKTEVIDDDFFESASRIETTQDITESGAYSLQEVKIKSETDRETEEAEKKKQATRNYIQELRTEYLALCAESEKHAAQKKSEKPVLSVDPTLKGDIEKDTADKVELVKKELAWISEKETLATEKLRQKFLVPVQTERIEVKAIDKKRSVSTFRTHILDLGSTSRARTTAGSDKASVRASITGRDLDSGKDKRVPRKSVFGGVRGANKVTTTNKMEARKAQRSERMNIYKDLLKTKPDDKYEDPKDVAAIRYAQNHMGDYKLKTAENYIVPDNERVDTDKKKRQINLLSESIFLLKEQFNQQVIHMRDYKRELFESVGKKNGEIMSINAQLKIYQEQADPFIWLPSMENSAYPEHRFIVTDEDIAKMLQDDISKSHNSKKGDDVMGFGNGSAVQATKDSHVEPDSSDVKKGAITSTILPSLEGDLALVNIKANRTALEVAETELLQEKLLYRKRTILNSIQQDVVKFDDIIDKLCLERVLLEADLKFADIKLLVLYKEYVLLKEFEKYDNVLSEKLATKENEKTDIESKIIECQEKANRNKAEIEAIILKEKEIQDDFSRAIGPGNKYESYFVKVFKKKIKRSKKKAKTANNNDDEEESEEDSDIDDYDSNAASQEEEEAYEEKCPGDCDPALWARILDLREMKLDEEERVVEIQKIVDILKKENETLLKKEKVIDAALRNTENEIQEFQTQKQRKLNELDVVVPLRFHQIQNLVKNAIPRDLSSSLVFTNDGLVKLRARIKELQQEKTNVKKQHRELKKNHVTLNKSKKDKELKIQELTSRALDVQMLKFGRTIDLEKLEKLGVNRNAEELKEKITREEAKHSAELAQWDSKIAKLKEDLTAVTKENTLRLQALGDLVENRKKLEDTLNYNQATVTAEYSGPQKKDVVERDKLIKLVQNQSGEIEELKNEIEFLIRKPIRQGGQPQGPKSFKTDLTASMSASPDILSRAVKESLGHLQGTAKAAEPRPPSEPRISLPRPGQEVSTPPVAAIQQGEEIIPTN